VRYIIEETATGFSGYCPDVPGLGVAGETRDEVIELLNEGVAFHQEDTLVACGFQKTHVFASAAQAATKGESAYGTLFSSRKDSVRCFRGDLELLNQTA